MSFIFFEREYYNDYILRNKKKRGIISVRYHFVSHFFSSPFFCPRRESRETRKIDQLTHCGNVKNSVIWAVAKERETAVFCTFSALINASSRRGVVNTDKSKESDAFETPASKHRSINQIIFTILQYAQGYLYTFANI